MALFNFAAHEMPGWLAANQWTGIEAPRGRAAKRIPWDPGALGRLFDSPLYRGSKSNFTCAAGIALRRP